MPRELNAQQVGTQRRNPTNDPKTRVVTGLTKFPMSYKMPNTARYGHITPFYYQHSRGDDTIPLFSEHELRTYTLQSPMMSDLNMNKSYFMVDMKAIYPRNWDLMLVNPSKGDDVPADTRCVVSNILSNVYNRYNAFKNFVPSAETPYGPSFFTDWFKFVFLLESIFSNGSLFSEFDIHLSDFVYGVSDPSTVSDYTTHFSFDTWFDTVFVDCLKDTLVDFTIDGLRYQVRDDIDKAVTVDTITYIPLRRAIELMRHYDFRISQTWQDASDDHFKYPLDRLFFDFSSVANPESDIAYNKYPINLEVILGYQLGCAQFFTDSHVDYVYNASLYRDAIQSLYVNVLGSNFPTFSYNGSLRLYDVFSGNVISRIFTRIGSAALGISQMNIYYNILKMLFNHQNSLRYGDYFVTGRPNPLGIGDVSVDTSQASVSVVDITRNIQMQRFLNAVNLAKQNVGDYARSVLGLDNAHDVSYEIPAFLGHKTLPIRGMEIENTGSEQREPNSVTTILRSSNNVHAFELRTKRPCIVYGVYTFDVARIYTKTFDRMHMHEDRFDDFIPQLQYLGDQPIFKRELNSKNDVDTNYAYALRYMEYKIRHHYAAGGTIEALPSWFFNTDGTSADPLMNGSVISPSFIRSQPTEFDRFYSSLTGYSLGTYFHFIVMTTNHQTLTRKMDYAPEPLK